MTEAAQSREDFEDSYESDSDYSTGSESDQMNLQDRRQPEGSNLGLPPPTPRMPGFNKLSLGDLAKHSTPPSRPKVPALGLSLQRRTSSDVQATPRQPETEESVASVAPALNLSRLQPSMQQPVPPSAEESNVRSIHKPPPLSLGVTTGDSEASTSPRLQHHNSLPPSGAESSIITLELLSPALQLGAEAVQQAASQRSSQLDVLRHRCSSILGIAGTDLKFLEVRELSSGADISPECRRLAVSVNRSGFSLRALEETLADNKRLTSTAEKSTSALESMHQLVREQNQAVAKAQMKAAEVEAQLRRAQEACKTAENEVATLRQQLQRSDQLRLQGQKALDELKREFEALTRDITAEGLARTFSSPSQPPTRAPSARGLDSGNGRREAPRVDQRVAAVLERLCDEKVLSRLERFMDASNNMFP